MKIKLLKSKIHRATVTEANLEYVGSIGIDSALMQAANIVEFEKVHILNITNGHRLTTYAISSPKHSGEICINGAAAHLVSKGDLVIIIAYCLVNSDLHFKHVPVIVHVNQANIIKK